MRQNWEGVAALNCSTCLGTFFPGANLKKVLDKLSADPGPVDPAELLEEIRKRAARLHIDRARERGCPACGVRMKRINYAKVSRVMIEVCDKHGTWVDEVTFCELTEFVGSASGVVVKRVNSMREAQSNERKRGALDPNAIDRILSGDE